MVGILGSWLGSWAGSTGSLLEVEVHSTHIGQVALAADIEADFEKPAELVGSDCWVE